MIAGLCRPPPVTSQRRGGVGKIGGRDRGGGERHQRRRAVGRRQRVEPAAGSAAAKSSRSSDFGAGRAKYGCASNRASTAASTRPDRASAPSRSNRSPVCRATQSSSGPLPGPVSNASRSSRPSRSRSRWRRRRCSAPRPASAGRAPAPRDRSAPAARPAPPAATSAERKSHATRMPVRHASRSRRRRSARSAAGPAGAGWSGRGSRSGRPPRPARSPPARGTRSAAPRRFSVGGHPGPVSVAWSRIRRRSARSRSSYGSVSVGPNAADTLAVGLQPGRVHAVQRGAAHQPDRPQHFPRSRSVLARARIPDTGPDAMPQQPISCTKPPSAASSSSAPTPRRWRRRAARRHRVRLYRLRLHRGQPACRQPGRHHDPAPAAEARPSPGRADGRRHHAHRRSVGQGRVAPAADRRADRRQHGRHPPLLRAVPALRRRARPTRSCRTTTTG